MTEEQIKSILSFIEVDFTGQTEIGYLELMMVFSKITDMGGSVDICLRDRQPPTVEIKWMQNQLIRHERNFSTFKLMLDASLGFIKIYNE